MNFEKKSFKATSKTTTNETEDKEKEDCYTHLEEPSEFDKLNLLFCAGVMTNIAGKIYLFGTIARKEKKTDKYLIDSKHIS